MTGSTVGGLYRGGGGGGAGIRGTADHQDSKHRGIFCLGIRPEKQLPLVG